MEKISFFKLKLLAFTLILMWKCLYFKIKIIIQILQKNKWKYAFILLYYHNCDKIYIFIFNTYILFHIKNKSCISNQLLKA